MNHKLKDVMTKDVHVVPPNCSVREAAQKMRDLDVGTLPVCDKEKLVGIVTDRDIVVKATAKGLDPSATTVDKIMSSPVVYGFEDQTIEEAARLMEVKQIRRLLVLSRDKKLVGITSLGDIAVRTGQDDLAGEILEKVSEPIHGPH